LTFILGLLKLTIMKLFGTSGIRRLADRELVELALKVGMAIGAQYPGVVIGRDTRTYGSAMRHSIAAGILTAGAQCYDAGVIPTPTVAFVTRKFNAGVMITASHNPPPYNGIKLLNPDGSAFSEEQQRRIENFIQGTIPLNASWDKIQAGETYNTAVEEHIAGIRRDFPTPLKLKVVVDAGCGAAYFITAQLLLQLGCEVIPLNCYANGNFPHDVEPIESNLGDLISAVKKNNADLGIAHDGDADRMMAVDNLGRFITGDKMLTLLAQVSGSKDIVTTIDASMVIENLGFNVKRTKVGDPFVSEVLKQFGKFGGEPSGAWVFPQISLCPDGIYAAASIAAIASRSKLSDLVDNIPSYPLIRTNIAGTLSSMKQMEEKLAALFKPIAIDNIDGLKLSFKDGWLLVRPSGTEPKIRISAEGKNQEIARYYCETSSKFIKDFVQGK
jgi:phosphoglucosamine mutase